MEISSLKHSVSAIAAAVKVVSNGDSNSWVAAKPCQVLIPKHWMETGFGNIGSTFDVLAFVGIKDDNDNYASVQGNTSLSFNPYDVSVITIEDTEYYSLAYQPGETMIESDMLVKDSIYSYHTFNEFHAKAKTPFYMNYVDIGSSMRTSLHHAGFNTNADESIMSVLVANRFRNPKKASELLRYTFKTQADVDTARGLALPLMSVSGATSTSSRLLGNYQNEGIVESMITPTAVLNEADKIHFL